MGTTPFPPLVVPLFFSSCPPAIFGGISLVIVDPVKGEGISIPSANGPIVKRLEAVPPFLTNSDTMGTIIFLIIGIVRVVTAAFHLFPDTIKPSSSLSVGGSVGPEYMIFVIQAPARNCCTSHQTITGNNSVKPTITVTEP